MRGNWLVIWNVNGVDGAGWKAAAGRRGCSSKGQSLCGAVPLRMPVGRYELLRLRQSGDVAEQQAERKGAEDLLSHLITSGSPNMTVWHMQVSSVSNCSDYSSKSFSFYSPYKDQPYIQNELKPVMTGLWSGTSTQHIAVYDPYQTYTKS